MSFRPSDVGLLFGQDHIQVVIAQWLEHPDTIPQSVLFSGPFGCGKTSIARMLAKTLVTIDSDLEEINAAEARGIDDVRAWIESSRFRPFGKAKVYIIDELHGMTTAAQSALLKVIEEPPKGVYFFLCTTEPSKLLPTIRSRCHFVEVRLLTKEATFDLLSFLGKGKFTDDLKEAIYLRSGGHARDAVKTAELLLNSGGTLDPNLVNQVLAPGSDIRSAQTLLHNLITNPTGTIRDYTVIARVADPRALADMLDQNIDSAMLDGNARVCPHYYEFLLMRAYRKEYKVTAAEQALHVISRLVFK